ncbi:MAG: hypothetical protein K0R73_597 [Candidatus Midichloriaceae bacterium]|jgi:Skp family chaperone for outer membrane proteins|nr:hypothetical protein [Candidatus Midichloriaceae bacterium]
MKLITSFIIGALFVANAAFACNSYECKKKALLADKEISEAIKKEIKDYYEKDDKLYNECKDKRSALKNALSEDAKKALAKHHKRKKSNAQEVKVKN